MLTIKRLIKKEYIVVDEDGDEVYRTSDMGSAEKYCENCAGLDWGWE